MSERKSIFGNFIYNALYNVMNVLFPLITIPYLSRVLMSDGLGKINYARNIVSWFLIFASLGIPRYGVREIARVRSKKELLDKTFSELFIINLISTLGCVVIFLALVFNVAYFKSRLILFLVTGIQLLLNIFNVDWFYQGMEEYSYITRRSFIIKLFSLVLMFVFVKNHDDYIAYALLQSFAVAGNYIFNFIHLKKYIKIVLKNIELKKHLIPIMILLSTSLATTVYSLLDTTILGIFCSDSVIGYYSNCHKVIQTIATLTASLGSVMLPRLVKYYEKDDKDKVLQLSTKALQIILVVCTPITIGLFFEAKSIVLVVFGADFVPSIITLQVFAPFILLTTIGNLYGTQLLMMLNREKELLITVSVGAGINLVLNLILVNTFQQNGVAFASVVTEAIVMVAQIIAVQRQKLWLRLSKRFVVSTVIMNIGLTLFCILINRMIASYIIEILIAIIGGGGIYLFVGSITHNEAIFFILERIRGTLVSTTTKIRKNGY